MFGKGLGSAMLSFAVAQAWSRTNTTRVWLHTCTEDHPHALANYQKRGFRLFKTVEE
jgi:GNAT superfamily N-acetyltransferase